MRLSQQLQQELGFIGLGLPRQARTEGVVESFPLVCRCRDGSLRQCTRGFHEELLVQGSECLQGSVRAAAPDAGRRAVGGIEDFEGRIGG